MRPSGSAEIRVVTENLDEKTRVVVEALSPDGQRLSCAGSTASLDLCCAWMATLHGERVGQELMQALGQARDLDRKSVV